MYKILLKLLHNFKKNDFICKSIQNYFHNFKNIMMSILRISKIKLIIFFNYEFASIYNIITPYFMSRKNYPTLLTYLLLSQFMYYYLLFKN